MTHRQVNSIDHMITNISGDPIKSVHNEIVLLLLCGDIEINLGNVAVCSCCSELVWTQTGLCAVICVIYGSMYLVTRLISVADYDALVFCPSDMP